MTAYEYMRIVFKACCLLADFVLILKLTGMFSKESANNGAA